MRPSASLWLPGSCLLLACALAAQTSAPFDQAQGRPPAPAVWTYGGTPAQTRHSPLTQINRANVKQLEVAWTYDTGEPGGLQTQPLVVGDVLYGYTPTHKLFAVDAATGRAEWVFDSGVRGTGPNRGVMYWADGARAARLRRGRQLRLRARRRDGQTDRHLRRRAAASTCARTSGAIRRRRA